MPFGKPDHTWEDNTEMSLVEGIHLAQVRDWWQLLMDTVVNLHIPRKASNFLTS
jgi:hypothetical protein